MTKGLGNDAGLSCEELEEKVEEADRQTEILFPPAITGKWVSEKCEVRAGPEYNLRSQSFSESELFESITWFYRDESCSHPLYSISVSGRYSLRGRSWLTPGATRIDYAPYNIVVSPYTQQRNFVITCDKLGERKIELYISKEIKMADELCTRVNSSCPGQVKRKWRPHHEYTVHDIPLERIITDDEGEMTDGGEGWAQCVKSLFKEGALIRVQRRPGGLLPNTPRPTTQLLLGDLRPHAAGSAPTTFRSPLVRIEQVEGCEACRTVYRGSSSSPPQLLSQPKIPPYLAGEWLSISCEARPLGLFLRRKLRISGKSWRAEYKFFSDPLCSTSSLTAAAEGYFKPAPIPVSRISGATDFDFMIERAFLTLHDQGLVQTLQQDTSCGPPGMWQTGFDYTVIISGMVFHSTDDDCIVETVGVLRDLTPSKGCSPLGITVPSTEYELARLEVDSLGNTMLLLGQSDPTKKGADGKVTTKHRPTAFQPPLLQCNAPELPPLTHFLNGYNSALEGRADLLTLCLCFLWISLANYIRLYHGNR